MGNKICTSLEQSKKLLELGIEVNTADMFWDTKPKSLVFFPITNSNVNWKIAMDEDGEFPAWSLSALLGLMPDIINLNGMNYRQQEFKTKNGYCYCYADERFPISFHGQPVDAAFEMVCWLKENGKL